MIIPNSDFFFKIYTQNEKRGERERESERASERASERERERISTVVRFIK
jgi:hypothetical protein